MTAAFHAEAMQASLPNEPASGFVWPADTGHIPDWVYTDQRIYERELERIFQGRTWNYVALEAEVPKPGDYIRSYVGPFSVIVARDQSGEICVFENRCSHRGVEFCKSYRGHGTEITCPYHQWTYDLTGRLIGVPFRRGLRGTGGMPQSFQLEDHSLRRLSVARRGGVVFASFRNDVEPLADYIGSEVLAEFDTVFDGRELMLLGHHRNTLPGNWKLYQENLKDPYHATLLHTYLTTFGLFVAGNQTSNIIDPSGRHHATRNARPAGRPTIDEDKAAIGSFHEAMKLNDPRIIEFVREFSSPWSSSAITLWPNVIILRQTNILGTRHIVPNGPNEFILVWTVFGYADDSPEMTRHRLRQNNIFGPGGFLGIDDHEALKFVQDGLRHSVSGNGLALAGSDDPAADSMITERPIREMYRHYRQVMGL